MTFFSFFSMSRKAKSDNRTGNVQKPAIKQVAQAALKKYEKTFADLARYDRGEKTRFSVPR